MPWTTITPSLLEFASTLVRHYEIGDVIYRLTDSAVAGLAASGAGVSLHDDGHLVFISASDQRTAAAEEVQQQKNEGVCHQAFATKSLVVVNNLTTQGARWPAWGQAALDLGFRAVMGVPMSFDDQAIGALNVYFTEPNAITPETEKAARILADMATSYIVHARALEKTNQLAGQLQNALDSRVVIEQAKGMLAGRHRIDVGSAFERLRAHSRSTNTKLHDIAAQVVDGKLDL